MFKFFCVLLMACLCLPGSVNAAAERPKVAYTGIYLMGDKKAEANFTVYLRNKDKLSLAMAKAMKQVDARGKLPFTLQFDTDSESDKLRIDNTLSLALVVVRDDINTESFSAAGTTINKTIVNVGLVAILYDTRKIEGSYRNTVMFSFPLVGYAQRLDGDRQISASEIDTLFVDSAVATLRDHLVKRLAGVTVEDIYGQVISIAKGKATINIGSLKGVEDGQNVFFQVDGKKISCPIVSLDKQSAVLELPETLVPKVGMNVRVTNMRAVSDETFQVVDTKVSSKKVAAFFPPKIIGAQVAQWFSNFLTDRGGKVVLPSKVGGAWDDRATAEAFTIITRGGDELTFELPKPAYPVTLDITGVASKVIDSNDVNDVCMFKAWVKLSVPKKNYEKEFEIYTSKRLIKGVQKLEEKNELFDLMYQLTAKMAREAQL